jgi:hypothetical protein
MPDMQPFRTSRLERSRNAGRQNKMIYRPVKEDQALPYDPNKKWEAPKAPRAIVRAFRDWWIELLAATLLTLEFSVLIAILRAYQREPLPKWPLGLSFNTALSVLGAIFRAPALFIAAEGLGQLKWQWLSKKRPLSDFSAYDDATRGPWGSTKLLWTARWRDLLAFLGALLTVASLGIDPFTQAVVGYYPCSVAVPNDTASATISHLNSFFSGDYIRAGDDRPTAARLAIDASYSDANAIAPPFNCTTDSCSFLEVYHTIGLCNKCVDVTEKLQTTCWGENHDVQTSNRSTSLLGNGCNYTLASPYTTHVKPNTTFSGGTTAGFEGAGRPGRKARQVLQAGTFQWNLLSIRKYDPQNNLYLEPNGPLGPFGTTGFSYSSIIDFVSAWPLLGCRCHLNFCVRSYTAIIDQGVIRETLQSTSNSWSNYTEDQTPVLGMVRVDCLKPRVRNVLLDAEFIVSDMEWMPWDGILLNGTEMEEFISDSADLAIPASCVYQLQLTGDAVNWDSREHFTDPLEGVLEGSGIAPDIDLDTDAPSLLAGLYDNGTVSVDSLNRAFNNFTSAVTNYLRTLNFPIPRNVTDRVPNFIIKSVPLNPIRGDPNNRNQPVIGQAYTETTCIHVRWPWLALPATIFLGTLVFLTLLIIKTTSHQELEVWKSSQNALIWHGLDGSAEDESGTLISKTDMDSRAKEIRVRLERTRKSWKLVQDE